MNLKQLAAASLAALLLSASPALSTSLPPSGQDELVEWQVNSSWKIPAKPLDLVHSLDGRYVYILTDSGKVQVFNNQGKLQGAIPVPAGVNAIDIAPQGETLYLIDTAQSSFTSVSVSFVHSIDIVGSPYKGAEDAPITIAVFTDFE
jgi:hypothetical protein